MIYRLHNNLYLSWSNHFERLISNIHMIFVVYQRVTWTVFGISKLFIIIIIWTGSFDNRHTVFPFHYLSFWKFSFSQHILNRIPIPLPPKLQTKINREHFCSAFSVYLQLKLRNKIDLFSLLVTYSSKYNASSKSHA